MTYLVRLDLSYNNIVKLSPQIGSLVNLQQLWINDNPLREVPLEIANCQKLKVSYTLLQPEPRGPYLLILGILTVLILGIGPQEYIRYHYA